MMKESRARILLSQQSSVAQKVYAAVPIQDAWDAKSIYAELMRSGFSHDFRIIVGCINSLIGSGLVIEKTKGFFQRAQTRKENAPVAAAASKATTSPAVQQADKSPIDRLSDLSGAFMKLSAQIKAAADELETVAIELAEQTERSEGDVAKLKQLQQLLKSIGG